ncbi:MAG: glycosyltransferase family 2 protein [Methylacidiphilales bacterium]|nr:glycosyltransferase family 2 protein [Candidatus Methylacidiphilales bacterium]
MTERILVFIPMYNCARQIGRVVAQLSGRIKPFIAEVLVLDNGSRDGGPDVARDALQRIDGLSWIVARNRENYNLGGSHKVAFDYAIDRGFSHVIVLHGDDQADIDDVVEALQAGLHLRYDSLLGARFMRGSRLHGYSLYRWIGNYGLNVLTSAIVRHWITDQGSGLNLYSTSYLASRFYNSFHDNLSFPAEMLYQSIFAGATFRFFPISWREEDQASNAKPIRQALQILNIAWNGKRIFSAPGDGMTLRGRGFDILYKS